MQPRIERCAKRTRESRRRDVDDAVHYVKRINLTPRDKSAAERLGECTCSPIEVYSSRASRRLATLDHARIAYTFACRCAIGSDYVEAAKVHRANWTCY